MMPFDFGNSYEQVPYINYDELDKYAERVIADAVPQSLNQPMPIDADAFLEFYLGLQVEYKKLCNDGKVLGLTAFNSGYIGVIDETTNNPIPMYVQAGTVVIDVSLLNDRNDARLRFTLMHEASHWLIHQRVFSMGNSTLNVAQGGTMNYSLIQNRNNDIERMERQADFLASALLMPRPTLRVAYQAYFGYFGLHPIQIVRGTNSWHDDHARALPKYISKQFNVSKQAAMIRLEKLNAIVNSKTA